MEEDQLKMLSDEGRQGACSHPGFWVLGMEDIQRFCARNKEIMKVPALCQSCRSQSITEVGLRNRNLGDEEVKALADALRVNQTVKLVDLHGSNLGNEGVKALADALRANKTIRSVDLCHNKIGNEGFKALASAIEVNEAITEVKLDMEEDQLKMLSDEGRQGACSHPGFWVLGMEDIQRFCTRNEVQALCQSCRSQSITEVGLRNRNLGDEEATSCTSDTTEPNFLCGFRQNGSSLHRLYSDTTEERAVVDPDDQRQRMTELRDEQINVLRNAHRQQFPLTDNLMSLVFLVQADLNENQRERFVTSMSLRQIDMAQYTYLQVKQLFMELFCTTRTGIADPTIRHVKRSTFLVIEEGEYDGETGYWVAEEETGDEGFVSLYIEDEFWVLSAKGGYNKRRVFSRRFKQGKGKGKGSQRKPPGFRPRFQKKGKGYLADDQVPDDQAFYGKKGKKGGKKGGKKQKDSFKSSKKGKTSKGDSSSSSGKANIAASSPSEEHVDAMEATAAGQDA
eukprot:symbB.v1.2.040218.t1/scaffold7081.1/size14668/1